MDSNPPDPASSPERRAPDPFPPAGPPVPPPVPPPPPTSPDHQPDADLPMSGLAITALALGILAVLTSCVGVGALVGVTAMVIGIVALGKMQQMDSRRRGSGLAIAGISLGGASLLFGLIAILMLGIMLPALGAARSTARQMQNNTQLRGIHQSLVIAAQSNSRHFVGLDRNGDPIDVTVENRFRILLDANYFTGDYAISPSEAGKTPWQHGMTVTSDNYSYAMLEVIDPGGRRTEWAETLNTEAAAIADRNADPAGSVSNPYSVHTGPGGGWRGSVAYNDNHVVFERHHVLPTTRYGRHQHRDDHLFEATGPDDALMIYEGDRGR
jgi:hypothetical protein